MKAGLFSALALGAVLFAGPALAQEDVEVDWNLGVASDYVFRGYSQTSEGAQVFGGVDLTMGSVYAGAWASNVDFGDSTKAEVDVYAGFAGEASGFDLDVGVVGYLYVSQPSGADFNYFEVKASAAREFGPVTLGAAVFWSPDYFGVDETATYYEANASFSPAPKWTVSGAVGHQALDVNDDYDSWNVGLAYEITEAVEVDVRYHDSNLDDPLADGVVVGSLKLAF
jgi:uncharacterized protein (TIGR02001 family)